MFGSIAHTESSRSTCSTTRPCLSCTSMIIAISGPGPEFHRLRGRTPSLIPRFDCAAHHHQALVRSGHGALNQKQISLRIDPQHLQVLHGYSVVAHAPGHPQPFEHSSRRRARTDGTRGTQTVRLTVRLRAAPETMALDHTLKATALRRAGHVDQVAFRERVGSDHLSDRHVGGVARFYFAQRPRHEPTSLAVTPLRPIQALVETKSELDGTVAVPLRGLDLRHHAGANLEYRHRVGQPCVIKYLGHAQFFSDEPLDHWLSPVSQEAAQHLSRVRPQSVSSASGHRLVRPRATATT